MRLVSYDRAFAPSPTLLILGGLCTTSVALASINDGGIDGSGMEADVDASDADPWGDDDEYDKEPGEDAIPEGIQPTTTPDNLGCNAAASPQASASFPVWPLVAGSLVVILRQRRRRPGRAGFIAGTLSFAIVSAPSRIAAATSSASDERDDRALADESTPDSSLQDTFFSPKGAPRRFALSYNPFTLHLTRASLNLEVMVVSHHVIVLTPFYASTTTNSDSYNNTFRGFGGELGYRYYFGMDGPRGFYIGPSFLFGHYDAVPADGDTIPFNNFGGAVDAGWQATIADRWIVGLGAGLQVTVPTEIFPAQQLPASVYAIKGVRPRLLLALGFSFDL